MNVPELIVGVLSRLEVIKATLTEEGRALAIEGMEVYLDYAAKTVTVKVPVKTRPKAPDFMDTRDYGSGDGDPSWAGIGESADEYADPSG